MAPMDVDDLFSSFEGDAPKGGGGAGPAQPSPLAAVASTGQEAAGRLLALEAEAEAEARAAKRARKEARDAGEASARPAGCTLPMPCAVLGRHAAAGAHGAWPQPVAGGGVMALQPLASGLRVGREAAKDCVHEVAIPDG